jgi:ComF family protein
VEKLFWGRVSVEHASSYLYLEKGSVVEHLVHGLKYNGQKDIGLQMGNLFGQKLRNTTFNTVDAILPVPLHKKRKAKRGYNQSELIARGIGEIIGKPVFTNAVKRIVPNRSQTRKGRYERWLNVKDIFVCISPESLEGKHILIVDDIITTGATIESLIAAIQDKSRVKISIAVLASA